MNNTDISCLDAARNPLSFQRSSTEQLDLNLSGFETNTSIAQFSELFGFGSVSEAKTALALFKHIPDFPLIAGSSFQVDIDRSITGNHVLDFLISESNGRTFSVEFHPICLDREMKFNNLYRRLMVLSDKYKSRHLGKKGRLITSNDPRIPDISGRIKSLQKDICERYYIQKRAEYIRNSDSALIRDSTFVLIKGEHELLKFLTLWNRKLTKNEFETNCWSRRALDLPELLRANAAKEDKLKNYRLDFADKLPLNMKTRKITGFEKTVVQTLKQALIGFRISYGNQYSDSIIQDHRAEETYISLAPFHSLVIKPHEVNLDRELGQKLLVQDPFVKSGLSIKERDVYTGANILARYENLLSILEPDDATEFTEIQTELAKFTNYKRLRCCYSCRSLGKGCFAFGRFKD